MDGLRDAADFLSDGSAVEGAQGDPAADKAAKKDGNEEEAGFKLRDADDQGDTINAATVWTEENGITYYTYQDRFYKDLEATVPLSGQRKVGGFWYMFEPDGTMVRAMFYTHTKKTNPNGGAKTCYYDGSGRMLYGQQRIGGYWYNFRKGNGAMQTGFVYIPEQNKTCYYQESGEAGSGLGRMLYGQKKIKGNWYNFRQGNGAMQTGFVHIPSQNKICYYSETGKAGSGLGCMLYGQQRIGGYWYNFRQGNGAMQTGFVYIPEQKKTCYYNEQGSLGSGLGRMLYGEVRIDGTWYYLKPGNGALTERTETRIANMKVASEASQLIIVRASGTRASVSMYQKKPDGTFARILVSEGFVGSRGVGKAHAGISVTPRGAYHILKAFGIKSDPGCSIGYTKLDSTHYYVGDPYSNYYNKFVSTRTVNSFDPSYGEHLVSMGPVYNYILDFDYNPDGTPFEGSCFFLHCWNNRPTAGCISVPEQVMIRILQEIKNGCMIVIDNGDQVYAY